MNNDSNLCEINVCSASENGLTTEGQYCSVGGGDLRVSCDSEFYLQIVNSTCSDQKTSCALFAIKFSEVSKIYGLLDLETLIDGGS